MKTEIIKSPIEVANALAGLGFKREHFDEVIARMVTARNSCTENHPTGAGGYGAYSEGTCRLREVATLVGGWVRNNDNFIASIYSKELNGDGVRRRGDSPDEKPDFEIVVTRKQA